MEGTKAGLAAAIDQLYDQYADELYRYARFTLRDTHLAEDIVQEVFIRAIRAWDSFRGDASPRTWLWQIARNYMRDVMRRKQVRNRHSAPEPVELYDVGAPFESLLELEDQLSSLNDDQRQVFVLRCMQDLSVKDTATILGWTDSKVKTTLSRTLAKLREQITNDNEIDNGIDNGPEQSTVSQDLEHPTTRQAGQNQGGGPRGMERPERQV